MNAFEPVALLALSVQLHLSGLGRRVMLERPHPSVMQATLSLKSDTKNGRRIDSLLNGREQSR